jgi:hypothetical protein
MTEQGARDLSLEMAEPHVDHAAAICVLPDAVAELSRKAQ